MIHKSIIIINKTQKYLFFFHFAGNANKFLKLNIKAVLATNYFPSIEYVRKLILYEVIYIEAWENYQKHSFRNRCQICTSQGRTTLSIPLLKGKNNNCIIKDVKIANYSDWPAHHAKSIKTAYGKSPFYAHYEEWLSPLLTMQKTFLYDLNMVILESIIQLLELSTILNETTSYIRQPIHEYMDLRNAHNPKNSANNLNKTYEQVFSDRLAFVPNLSILDLIFCMGPETTHWLKSIGS